ncbi:hypothetical protein LGH82_18400 [Mesorhizobium sp. PAMC28654]|uniref:hypothetical protein n=1 Tax=Mesorhizobium sp. PAMC28654 TaxID=2880934 RepID=UPI001D0AAA9B|nr:hypothetical protein [Mesorhizobium sp. PAMC28654]UDL87173.1 hypothetical protein LGH82_18400 [Mesorhizobium sp. PAMC28654]
MNSIDFIKEYRFPATAKAGNILSKIPASGAQDGFMGLPQGAALYRLTGRMFRIG